MRGRTFAVAVLTTALGVACSSSPRGTSDGSTDGSPTDGAPGPGRLAPAQFQPYCERYCTRVVTCQPGADRVGCVANCVGIAGWARGDLIAALAACTEASACDALGTCGAGEAPALDIHATFRLRCEQKYSSCGLDPAVDGPCGDKDITSVNTDTMTELIACFDTACTAVRSCLDAAAARSGYTF